MVNELRTLLLNEAPAPGTIYEELIDPAFSPRLLGSAASAVRAAIFDGATLSRPYRNFVATTLARLVHASAVGRDFIGKDQPLDGRVFFQVPAIQDSTLGFSGTNTGTFQCGGAFSPTAGEASFAATWMINRVGPTGVSVASQIPGFPVQNVQNLTVAFKQDASAPLILPGSGGVFVQWVGTTAVPVGFQANVQAFNPPRLDVLGVLERLRALPQTGVLFSRTGVHASVLLSTYSRDGFPHEQLAAALVAYALNLLSA